MRAVGTDRRNLRILFFAVLTLLLLLFIFSNSLQNGEESNQRSGRVLGLVQRILDPFGRIPEESLHWFVRKAAHFTEFAALGASLWLLLDSIRDRYGTFSAGWIHFGALLSAAADEYIQSFTGRTSSVKDVLLDYSGALFGILLAAGIVWILRKRKHGGKSKPGKTE